MAIKFNKIFDCKYASLVLILLLFLLFNKFFLDNIGKYYIIFVIISLSLLSFIIYCIALSFKGFVLNLPDYFQKILSLLSCRNLKYLILFTAFFIITTKFGLPILIYAFFIFPPLLLIFALLPTITLAATVFCLGKFLGSFFQARSMQYTLSITLIAAAFLLPSWLANRNLEKKAAAFMAEDVTPASLPAPRILAMTHTTHCDSLCVRLLLNDQVRGVVMASSPPWTWKDDNTTKANLFFLKKAASCPDQALDQVEGDRGIFGNEQLHLDTRELLRLKLKREGLCLYHRPAHANEIDGVLHKFSVYEGVPEDKAGLNIFANTIFAQRLLWSVRKGKEWIVKYKSTEITIYKLWPVLILAYKNITDDIPGFMRSKYKINKIKSSKIHFLQSVLKLKLHANNKD